MAATGVQRFAMQQLERAAGAVPDLPLATVTVVTPSASTDGIALVTVTYLGASLQFPYLTSYTPVVGHRVALGLCGGVWTILGRPGGFPPAT